MKRVTLYLILSVVTSDNIWYPFFIGPRFFIFNNIIIRILSQKPILIDYCIGIII